MQEHCLPSVVLVPPTGRLVRLRGLLREAYEYGDREYTVALADADDRIACTVTGEVIYAGRRGNDLNTLDDRELPRFARTWGVFQLLYFPQILDRLEQALNDAYKTNTPPKTARYAPEGYWTPTPTILGQYDLTSSLQLSMKVPFAEGLETLLNTVQLTDVKGTYEGARE